MSQDFEEIFERLKAVLKPLEKELKVKTDEPGKYYLITRKLNEKKQEVWFGGVETKKNYVSFHLIPVYLFPELLNEISSDLKKKQPGKACFNFKKLDDALLTDLENLTRKSFNAFKQKEMI